MIDHTKESQHRSHKTGDESNDDDDDQYVDDDGDEDDEDEDGHPQVHSCQTH
jgi:hypothetical protein